MLSEQWDTKGSSSNKSTWQNRLRSLSKEMVSRLETLTVLSEMWSSGDFVFVLLSFLNVMYRVVLIGVDLPDFVEIHHNLIASWTLSTLHLPYSQTFCKLQRILWTFLRPFPVVCLVLVLIPSSDILNIVLLRKLSPVFSELPSMCWKL